MAILTPTVMFGPGPRRGRAGVSPRPRRAGGAALGPRTQQWPGFTPFVPVRPGFGSDLAVFTPSVTFDLGPRRGRAGVSPRPRRVGGAALGPRRLRTRGWPGCTPFVPVGPDSGRIWPFLTPSGVCAERAESVKLCKKKQVSSGSFVILSELQKSIGTIL